MKPLTKIPRVPISSEERNRIELMYDGRIPEHLFEPRIEWPDATEDIWIIQVELAAQADALRKQSGNDGTLSRIERDIELCRQEIERRESKNGMG